MSVPPSVSHSPSDDRRPEYTYRRPLEPRELLPAVGAGVAAGLAVFYVVRELLARTPLVPYEDWPDHSPPARSGRA